MRPVQIQYPKRLGSAVRPRPVQEDFSVVIPTVGRDILETCLAYLAEGTVWPKTVIVVDQGEKPEVARTMDRLAKLGMGALYLPSSQRGRSSGINRGLERVETRFVTITDDDCFVAPDWLESMSDRLRVAPQNILTGRVELAGDETAFSIV